jgi:hypothetical protein
VVFISLERQGDLVDHPGTLRTICERQRNVELKARIPGKAYPYPRLHDHLKLRGTELREMKDARAMQTLIVATIMAASSTGFSS